MNYPIRVGATILSVSLSVNCLLAIVLLFGDSRPRPSKDSQAPSSLEAARDVPPSSVAVRSGATASGPKSGPSFSSPEQIRDRLRALGLPESVVRRAIQEHLLAPFQSKVRRMLDTVSQREGRGYWQSDGAGGQYMPLPAEMLSELREQQRKLRADLRRLLGPAPRDARTAYLNNTDFLPPEKGERLSELNSDYAELRMRIMQQVRGFPTDEDKAQLELLRKESERDLGSLLTPEEKAQYDMRVSSTTGQMRRFLSYFDASESEYRSLYALFDKVEKKFGSSSDLAMAGYDSGSSMEYWHARSQALTALNPEIEQALGADRYAAYQRAQDRDYQRLQAAALRFELPSSTVDQVYALRDKALEASLALRNDESLSADARREACAKLAEDIRRQVRTSLGAELGESYLKQAMSWLNYLERGTGVKVSSTGTILIPDGPVRYLQKKS